MKKTLLSFSDSEIHCQVIAEAGSAEERKKLFGIPFTPTLFMVCSLVLSLTFDFYFQMLSKGTMS